MKKLKWILRAVTIFCVVLPLLFTVLTYKDNLLGLIIPPQIMNAASGQGSMQQLLPNDLNISDVNPTYNNDFQFNSNNGSFRLSFNITNPLNNTITINTISFSVADANGTILGTLELNNPVVLLPGENSTVPIGGTLSPDFVNFLQSQGVDLTNPNFNPENMSKTGLNPIDLHLTNVQIDIGGIQVQMGDLNLGELGGLFGSNKGMESEK